MKTWDKLKLYFLNQWEFYVAVILNSSLRERVHELEMEVEQNKNDIDNLHKLFIKKTERFIKLEDYIKDRDNVRI